jgi:hypothetical protein
VFWKGFAENKMMGFSATNKTIIHKIPQQIAIQWSPSNDNIPVAMKSSQFSVF